MHHFHVIQNKPPEVFLDVFFKLMKLFRTAFAMETKQILKVELSPSKKNFF